MAAPLGAAGIPSEEAPSSIPSTYGLSLKRTALAAREVQRDPDPSVSERAQSSSPSSGPSPVAALGDKASPWNTHTDVHQLALRLYPNYEYMTKTCARPGAFFTHG